MEIGSQIAPAFIYQIVCFSKCHQSLFHTSQSYQESVTQETFSTKKLKGKPLILAEITTKG